MSAVLFSCAIAVGFVVGAITGLIFGWRLRKKIVLGTLSMGEIAAWMSQHVSTSGGDPPEVPVLYGLDGQEIRRCGRCKMPLTVMETPRGIHVRCGPAKEADALRR